ncbi:lysophospholipid acyltransferase family protein [Pseudooceanicola sp. HF7]|uniref:lysophospholipid acyltransferase family protein n=1 Tax=Pseudooceanicola sp. HF7 TaxID=2721560 RepID=UPI001430DB80|nr:lysophospholipid acyltransferase family protein [Pseudooceanicola sp. HF7]NIZ09841.1 lysophospholipid acyltransferase family protein [Pseudooceanicola sp. HF7]
MQPSDLPPRDRVGYYIVNLLLTGLIKLALALPYKTRVRFMGWLFAHVVGPLAGWNTRVRDNLALVWPDLPEARVGELERGVADNAGRSLIEMYSSKELRRGDWCKVMEGPGVAAYEAARAKGQPIIFASAHFGSYEEGRALLTRSGSPAGALYRPLNNPYFDRHYVSALSVAGTPLFARGRRGLGEMVRHLKGGGNVAILLDQHMGTGAELTFMGHRAYTSTSPFEIAERYGALVIPCFAIRQPDGLSFHLWIEEPIPSMAPEAMAQAYNDTLEALVHRYPEQWLWVHRRWKEAG